MTNCATLIEQLYGIADAAISLEERAVIVEAATLLAANAASAARRGDWRPPGMQIQEPDPRNCSWCGDAWSQAKCDGRCDESKAAKTRALAAASPAPAVTEEEIAKACCLKYCVSHGTDRQGKCDGCVARAREVAALIRGVPAVTEDKTATEQIILDWLRHNGHTWGTGPGSLIAELAAHGYKIVRKDDR